MTDQADQHVIRVSGLRYEFPGPERLSLAVPSFTTEPGQHTAIVGPSGCGKTTLLRLIVGIITPSSGRITTLGIDPTGRTPAQRGRDRLGSIGMVFQEFALLNYLSALENIILTARLGGCDLPTAKSRARELASNAGIAHTLARKPDRLSQGERQRVAICRALVTRPRLLICDEPTGNLDAQRSGEVMDIMFQEAESIDATVIAVTHDASLLGRFDRSVDLADIASLEGPGR